MSPDFWPKGLLSRRGGRRALLSRSTGCAGCLEAVTARGQPEVAFGRRATRRQKCQPCAATPPTLFSSCNLAKFTFKRQPRSCPAEAPATLATTPRRSTGCQTPYGACCDANVNKAGYSEWWCDVTTHQIQLRHPHHPSPDTLTSHSRAAHAATASRHSRAAHSAWASRNLAAMHSPSRASCFASAAAQP